MLTNERAVISVFCAALVALCLLLPPGDWKALTVLPVFAWWAAWSILGQHHRARHALDRELDDQADALDRERLDEWPPMEPDEAEYWPDEEVDPVGYYAMRARRYAQPWQQHGPDEGPHLLAAPLPEAAESDTGEAGPPALDGCTCTAPRGAHRPPCAWAMQQVPAPRAIGPSFDPDGPGYELDWREMVSDEAAPLGHQQAAELPELDHTAELDVQSAELAAWPAAEDLADRMAADSALERTRASFDLLRRMWL